MAVAPFTGAWIETAYDTMRLTETVVAPFTGAWIETRPTSGDRAGSGGRPLHGGVD